MKLSTEDFVLLPGYAVIVVIGIIGNFLILAVVKRERYMHIYYNKLSPRQSRSSRFIYITVVYSRNLTERLNHTPQWPTWRYSVQVCHHATHGRNIASGRWADTHSSVC